MKGGVRRKHYNILLIGLYISLPVIGWKFGGIILAGIGLVSAYFVDFLFPKWKYELTWKDIDIALFNLYKYGRNPSELCFRVDDRKIFVYRDEKGHGEPPIRMSVRLPLQDWSDLFDQEEFNKLLHKFGGMGLNSKDRGPESYGLFPSGGWKDCKEILKILFQKSVGGLRPEIMAQSVINTKKVIWLNHGKEGNNASRNGTTP